MAKGNGKESLTIDSDASRINILQRMKNHIQGKTLGGLMELAPLLVSAIVLWFIVGWADQFVRPLSFVAGRPWDFPGVGLIAAVVVFYLVGLLVSTKFGKTIMAWKDNVLNLIPVVKTVYGVTQQASTSMSRQFRFSRVVLLEWPREGC